MVKLVLPGTMNHLRTCDMMPEWGWRVFKMVKCTVHPAINQPVWTNPC